MPAPHTCVQLVLLPGKDASLAGALLRRCHWKKAGVDMTEDEVASMSTDTTGVPGGRTHMWMAEAYGGRHCVLLFAACPIPASTAFLTQAHTEQTHMPPLNCHTQLPLSFVP